MVRSSNLVIVHTRRQQDITDWRTVASKISERAPDVHVRIVDNGLRSRWTRYWQPFRPSLVFSPLPLQQYRPKGGKVYSGRWMSKEIELQRMREAGLPVPETVRLTPDLRLAGVPWEPYVIVKPIRGRQGQGIRLVRTEDLPRRHDELTRGGTMPMLVQQFIDHIDDQGRPCGFRVLTLFGHELLATLKFWREARRPLDEIAADPDGIIASNDATTRKDRRLACDEDVLALARSVSRALPKIPVLGVDIIRETGTGKLYITETNPSGETWHFSSHHGEVIFTPEFRKSLYAQFNAIDRITELLIEKTRAEAR